MQVKIKRLKTHEDKRGIVFGPIDDNSIKFQRNSHVFISKPSAIRSNHYHLSGTETLSVMGPALLIFREENEMYEFEMPLGQVYKFVIPPNVSHAIKNLGKKNNILIAVNTVSHIFENPDVKSDILMDK